MRAAASVVLVAAVAGWAIAQPPSDREVGVRAFREVARVLQSPRCRNCHPAGDAPLQTDAGRPHAQAITRASVAAGLPCAACHQDRNAEAIGIVGGPPGAPGWALPPATTPMVFERVAPRALCEQLRDPERNGGRLGPALLDHVAHDPLVRWAWQPGGGRSRPPLNHPSFVAAFAAWTGAGMPCPP